MLLTLPERGVVPWGAAFEKEAKNGGAVDKSCEERRILYLFADYEPKRRCGDDDEDR